MMRFLDLSSARFPINNLSLCINILFVLQLDTFLTWLVYASRLLILSFDLLSVYFPELLWTFVTISGCLSIYFIHPSPSPPSISLCDEILQRIESIFLCYANWGVSKHSRSLQNLVKPQIRGLAFKWDESQGLFLDFLHKLSLIIHLKLG